MRYFIFLLVLILFTIKSYSVQDTVNSGNNLLGQYSKARIVTNNFSKIEATDLSLYTDKVVYKDIGSNKEKSISLSDITMINAAKGTYILAGTLFGAIGGISIPAILAFKGYEVKGEAFIFATVVGAVIGCAVGYSLINYKTVYHTGDFFISLSTFKNAELLYPNKGITKISLQIFIN